MLDVIARQEDNFNDIVVCAHNPGNTDLANRLCGTSIDNIPTCGIVVLEAEIPGWADLGQAEGDLIYFDFPKNRLTA